jgi:hypothetical protein
METTKKTDCEYCGKPFKERKSKRYCSATCRTKACFANKAPVTKESLALTLEHLRNLYAKSKNMTPEKEEELNYAIKTVEEIQGYKEFQ